MDTAQDHLQTDLADLPALPDRPTDAHKGTFGTVMVVGGSSTMLGAPALAAGAALRSGAGLVKIVIDTAILPHVLTIEPCATGIATKAQAVQTIEVLSQADPQEKATMAVGPGLGQDKAACELVEALLAGPRRMVLDADALNILAHIRPGGMTSLGPSQLVLTPHPGEFRRLAEPLGITLSPTDPAQRPQAAAALARAFGAVVVLKGSHTVIASTRQVAINPFANPAMATPGSGDVLTGVLAALIAQGCPLWDAAVLGAYLHSLAGQFWLDEVGPSGMTAAELMKNLPRAFAAVRQGSPG